jgi:hypothetical protein
MCTEVTCNTTKQAQIATYSMIAERLVECCNSTLLLHGFDVHCKHIWVWCPSRKAAAVVLVAPRWRVASSFLVAFAGDLLQQPLNYKSVFVKS